MKKIINALLDELGYRVEQVGDEVTLIKIDGIKPPVLAKHSAEYVERLESLNEQLTEALELAIEHTHPELQALLQQALRASSQFYVDVNGEK